MKRIITFICLISNAFIFCGCEKILDVESAQSTNTAVFQEIWTVMDSRYALFNIKQVNWDQIFNTFSGRVTDVMSEKQFFDEMADMLESLEDGHVALISKSDTAIYSNFYALYPINFNYENILNNYLKNNYKQSGPFVYSITDNVGYIYYSNFSADYSDSDLEEMMSQLVNTKGLIIDIRSNPGGKSGNVDRLASRFIDGKKLVKYEQRKNGPRHDSFGEPVPYYLSPSDSAYLKPVIVLSNRSCYSACNDFVLYLSELPQVKVYGDQTGGGGAIPLNYLLANGWKLQYSSSVTLSPAKLSIETGILPDRNIVITPINETNGIDPILEQAFINLK